MADEPNPPSPSGPGEGHRDHISRHEESRRQIVEGPIAHTDSIRNPSVLSGAAAGGPAAGGAAANLEEEEEYFSPREREPSPEALISL